MYIFYCCYFYNNNLEELVKLNSYWRNQNTPMVFNEQRFVFFFFIYNYFIHKYFSIIREHVVYPEIRLNDNDRNFGTNFRDVQSLKNSSFPPISHDTQKQNSSVRYYLKQWSN